MRRLDVAEAWVVNASPIILLSKIGQVSLLAQLSPDFVIPKAVESEIIAGPVGCPAIASIRGCLASRVVAVGAVPPEMQDWKLGAGETEVIFYASSNGHIPILDDGAARKKAKEVGGRVIGSAGVLFRAKQDGVLATLKPHLDALVKVGGRLPTEVRHELLLRAGEI